MLNSNLITIHQISFEAQVNKHLQTALCQKVFFFIIQCDVDFSEFSERFS